MELSPSKRELGKSSRDEFGHSGLTPMKSRDVSTDRDEEEESAEPLVSEEPPAAVDGTELLGGGDVATITARPASLDSQDCLCINDTAARSSRGGAEAAGGEQVGSPRPTPVRCGVTYDQGRASRLLHLPIIALTSLPNVRR